jgi:hypothetical protein
MIDNTAFRNHLLTILLRANVRRPSWPISSVIPLLKHLGHTMAYDDFMTFLSNDEWDDAVIDAANNLTRERYAYYLR